MYFVLLILVFTAVIFFTLSLVYYNIYLMTKCPPHQKKKSNCDDSSPNPERTPTEPRGCLNSYAVLLWTLRLFFIMQTTAQSSCVWLGSFLTEVITRPLVHSKERNDESDEWGTEQKSEGKITIWIHSRAISSLLPSQPMTPNFHGESFEVPFYKWEAEIFAYISL